MVVSLEFARELITGRKDFVVKNDPRGFTIIDYVYAEPDTFADPRRLDFRGIKFCSRTGKLLALPLRKFFNVGERPETQLGVLPWHRSHDVLEKLDGSMIHGVILDGRVRLMTRMGLTDTALRCEQFWGEAVQGWFDYLESGLTPIFEWVGPHNPHIVKYPTDRLVVTGLRCMATGVMFDWETLYKISDRLGFETVRRISLFRSFPYPVSPMHRRPSEIFYEVRGNRGNEEGVVIAWPHSDLRVKIKTEHYTNLHRTKDDLSREKDTALIVLEKRVDDLVPLLDGRSRMMLQSFSTDLSSRVRELANNLRSTVGSVRFLTRKNVALGPALETNPALRGAFWRIYDGADPIESITVALKALCSSGPDWSKAAQELNLPRWSGLNLGVNDVDVG